MRTFCPGLFFSCWIMSDYLQPHGLQDTRLPCASSSPGACSNSSPLSWWCHPTISSSITSFSSCPQSFPASGSFPMSPLFASAGQSIGASASASVLPVNIQDWFPLGWTGLIALQSKELSRVFSNTTVRKHQFFPLRLYDPTFTSVLDYLKNHSFDSMTLLAKLCLCFLICCLGLSQFFFQGASVLISWLQSPSAMILQPKKIKSVTVFIVSPSIWHEEMELDAVTLDFWMLNFKSAFSFFSFTFIKRPFSSSSLSA